MTKFVVFSKNLKTLKRELKYCLTYMLPEAFGYEIKENHYEVSVKRIKRPRSKK